MGDKGRNQDYLVKFGDDEDFHLIETWPSDDVSQKRERIIQYYTHILKVEGYDQDAIDRLKWLINNMAEKIVMKSSPESLAETIEAMKDTVEAAREDNLENLETIEINGNKFIYEKNSLEPSAFRERLEEIGNRTKGNSWMIYVDDSGELVIY